MKNGISHIVIKKEDSLKYLSDKERQQLDSILQAIMGGREKDGKRPVNTYYICNTDEPYASFVYGVIMGGETALANYNSLMGEKL